MNKVPTPLEAMQEAVRARLAAAKREKARGGRRRGKRRS